MLNQTKLPTCIMPAPKFTKIIIINNLTSEYSIKPNDPTIKINEEATQILSNYKTKIEIFSKLKHFYLSRTTSLISPITSVAEQLSHQNHSFVK